MFQRKFARILITLLASALFAGAAAARAQEGAAPHDASRQRRANDSPQRPTLTPRSPTDWEEVDAQDEDVVTVETDLANLLFTAVDKNKRFVTTLRREDIRVLEDGVEQQVFTFQRETDRPLSLAILIDTSGSQERTLPLEKTAARAFLDTIIRSQKDEVAVLSFDGEATLEQGLTGNVSRLRRAIDQIEIIMPPGYIGGGVVLPSGTPPISGTGQSRRGTTAIWDALWVTAEEVLSETSDKTRRAIILLTDGVDTSSRLKKDEAVERAVKADAVIYTIGIGDDYYDGVEKDTLRKLSERTGGRAYFPENEDDLRAAFAQIQEELRSQYLIAYAPANKRKDGSFRQVKIEVVDPAVRKMNLRLTYRQGYFARQSPAPTGSPASRP